jgi:hypothetical protein
LSDEERAKVEKYLNGKYGAVAPLPIPGIDGGKPLVRVQDPPPVQVLAPGFTVRQLPVDLTNVNNVLYRPDGKLLALGYDGNIWLLSDTDGDGLEDKAVLFWENNGRIRAPIGMALTPPGFKHGEGVLVASKGKVSLLLDTDRRSKADHPVGDGQGGRRGPASLLDHATGEGTSVRVHPRPLRVVVRRPVVPNPPTPRDYLDGKGARRPIQ